MFIKTVHNTLDSFHSIRSSLAHTRALTSCHLMYWKTPHCRFWYNFLMPNHDIKKADVAKHPEFNLESSFSICGCFQTCSTPALDLNCSKAGVKKLTQHPIPHFSLELSKAGASSILQQLNFSMAFLGPRNYLPLCWSFALNIQRLVEYIRCYAGGQSGQIWAVFSTICWIGALVLLHPPQILNTRHFPLSFSKNHHWTWSNSYQYSYHHHWVVLLSW